MKLLHREYQIPILAPNNVSVFYCKTIELLWVKVFVVLRMRMPTYEIADIYCLFGIVAECKADTKVSYVFCFNYIQFTHFLSSYNFLLIFVLRTLFFITKNFTHLSTMFL